MSHPKLFVHCVFATKNREPLLIEKYEKKIQGYIIKIIETHKCKILAINNVSDHMHILINLDQNISISNLMHYIKGGSSKFINDNHLSYGSFSWGQGYGCFTCSEKDLPSIMEYIKSQKAHHK